MDDIIIAVISGLLGTLGGFLAGSGKPLVDWEIEKKRAKHERRVKLVQAWRLSAMDHLQGKRDISDSLHYPELRSEMTDSQITQLETQKHKITITAFKEGISADEDMTMVMGIIDTLEKKWGLK